MAFDAVTATEQVKLLSQQSASAAHAANVLAAYKEQLGLSWSGEEIKYINQTIDDLIRRSRKLRDDTEALCRDMVRAIEVLSGEGAEEESAEADSSDE